MGTERTWTAAELELMTPDERDAIIRAGIVSDPGLIPNDLTDRARAKADARIAASEPSPKG